MFCSGIVIYLSVSVVTVNTLLVFIPFIGVVHARAPAPRQALTVVSAAPIEIIISAFNGDHHPTIVIHLRLHITTHAPIIHHFIPVQPGSAITGHYPIPGEFLLALEVVEHRIVGPIFIEVTTGFYFPEVSILLVFLDLEINGFSTLAIINTRELRLVRFLIEDLQFIHHSTLQVLGGYGRVIAEKLFSIYQYFSNPLTLCRNVAILIYRNTRQLFQQVFHCCTGRHPETIGFIYYRVTFHPDGRYRFPNDDLL